MGIFDFFSGDDAQKAAADQQAAINNAYQQYQGLANQQRTSLGTTLSNAVAPFQNNLTTGQLGQGAYADATGANGAAGNARAVQNFQTGPGYQFTVDQALQNILRGQEATGQAASGATNLDINQQVQGLANQQWQQYIQNLQPFLNTSATAATGISNANQNIGGQIGQTYGTQANAAYGTQVGIGNAQANADLAPYNASANFWNLASNLAGDVSKIFGTKSTQPPSA